MSTKKQPSVASNSVEDLFLKNIQLCSLVAKDTLSDSVNEAERWRKCLWIVRDKWQGPTVEVYSDDEKIYTQEGRVFVKWDSIRGASRQAYGRIRSSMPAGTRYTLHVDRAEGFALAQACLLVAVSRDFAETYSFLCANQPQQNADMHGLAHGIFANVRLLTQPPRMFTDMAKGRPTKEQPFLRSLLQSVIDLEVPQREALCRQLDVPEITINLTRHSMFWKFWERTTAALKVEHRLCIDGEIIGQYTKSRLFRVIGCPGDLNSNQLRVYTADQFRLVFMYIIHLPEWSNVKSWPQFKSFKDWMPRPMAIAMQILKLPVK